MNDLLNGIRDRSLSDQLFYLPAPELERRGVDAIRQWIGVGIPQFTEFLGVCILSRIVGLEFWIEMVQGCHDGFVEGQDEKRKEKVVGILRDALAEVNGGNMEGRDGPGATIAILISWLPYHNESSCVQLLEKESTRPKHIEPAQ